ncbi:MAG: glycosyl transferase [bacterium]
MRNFCTYFDSRFFSRAIMLYRSLRKHSPGCRLFSLCFDGDAYNAAVAMNLEGLIPFTLPELEEAHPELVAVKSGRTVAEYYLTCTPVLPLYILEKFQDVDLLTYVDSDLYFFSSPEPVFEEMADASIAITPHRFAPNLVVKEQVGLFNDGWISFRRDGNALACLRWWKERCLEWCHDRSENGKHAEQKYLDSWPDMFNNVAVINHPGANAGPWNLRNEEIRFDDGRVTICGKPLIFYHFSGIWRVNRWLYDTSLFDYHIRPSGIVRKKIYKPYLQELLAACDAARSNCAREPAARSAVGYYKPDFSFHRFIKSLTERQLMLVAGGRVISL